MPWNEPGNNNQDPWGKRKKSNGTPPDLDAALKNIGRKLGALFGGGTGGSSSSGGGMLLLAVVIIAVGLWWMMGWYTVNENERAIVLRFGQYTSTQTAGLHWYAPLIERIETVDTSKVEQETVRGRMYTQDENLVEVSLSVQYKIKDPVAYLFNVTDQRFTLEQVAESALRLVIGETNMDETLTTGKDEIRTKTEAEIAQIMEPYQLGIEVTEVNLQEVKAPDAVREAFDDYQNAVQDSESSINEANGYQKKETPLAEAQAQRLLQDAEAYRAQVVAKSDGEVQRFAKLLPQYQAAPDVTRNRLYLETMEEVFSKVSKVVVDVKQGNNVIYLPIDKMKERGQTDAAVGK